MLMTFYVNDHKTPEKEKQEWNMSWYVQPRVNNKANKQFIINRDSIQSELKAIRSYKLDL